MSLDDIYTRAKPLRLAIFDVDGVLTDGGLHYSDSGEETKVFDVRDGLGMPHLSIARLFEDNREKLRLEWLGGRGGGARKLDSHHIRDASKVLIGHLNFIHPNLIQVLGPSEVRYLESLDPSA